MENPWEEIYKDRRFKTRPHKEIEKMTGIFSKNRLKRILDPGCGTGRYLVYLADSGFELYGLDSSLTGLINTLRTLYQKNLTGYLTLHDMVKLPYENEYFNAIISIQVIHHNKVKGKKRQ